MPLPYRWLTSMMARCSGSNLLIDCGEGTGGPEGKGMESQAHRYHLLYTLSRGPYKRPSRTSAYHGNAERVEPLTLIGPKGLERVVGALRTIAPELPFELRFVELTQNREHIQMGPYVIDAYRVNHNVLCYGYSITIPRTGRFDVERARSQEIPQKFWSSCKRAKR